MKRRPRINYRIRIQKTEREWEAIDDVLRSKGHVSGVRSYVNSQVSAICEKFTNSPHVITEAGGDMLSKQFPIDEYQKETLHKLAKLMQRPMSSIIDDFLIVPLLDPSLSKR